MMIIMVDFTRLFLEQSGLKPEEKDSMINYACSCCGRALELPTITVVEAGAAMSSS